MFLGGPGVAVAPKPPSPRTLFLYRLEWTRALNAREVSWIRVKWSLAQWLRKTFCQFVETCRVISSLAPLVCLVVCLASLVSSCKPLSGLRGSLEALLGPSWSRPGSLLEPFGTPWPLLAAPGPLLGASRAALGTSWASLGPPSGSSWPLLGCPEGLLGLPWRAWGALGGSFGAFGRKPENR